MRAHKRARLAVASVVTLVAVGVGATATAATIGAAAAPPTCDPSPSYSQGVDGITVTSTCFVPNAVTATETATETVPGPTTTATITATATVPGPTQTVTVTATPTPTPTATPPVVKTLTDFTQQLAGLYFTTGTLTGTGVDQTIYRLPAHTSTKADPSSGTNQYVLMRLGGTDSAGAATVNVGGFTIEGTDQTTSLKAYGGMMLGWGTGSTIHDVKITGIPGYSSSPPGETFGLEVWRANAANLTNLTIDGTRTSDSAVVGATDLGFSYSSGGATITNLNATNAKAGFGVALFQAAGTYTFAGGCDLSHNRKAINIEESLGATYNFNGCDFRSTTGAPYVAQVTAKGSSSPVYFRDPKVDAWPLKVNTYGSAANGGTNVQKDSDIHLIINGVDQTANPAYLQITHL